MPSYPHTIDSGTGERLTFVGRRRDERGEFLEVHSRVAPGAGPPMHAHHFQEEGATVVRGRVGWVIDGGPECFAGPGESMSFAPGVVHRFWNAGEEELELAGYVRAPDNFEWFLTQVYASMRQAGGARPRLYDSAYLGYHYRDEFTIAEVPAPVRRFVFPLLVAAGRLLGLHRRFAGAPEPLREGSAERPAAAVHGRPERVPV